MRRIHIVLIFATVLAVIAAVASSQGAFRRSSSSDSLVDDLDKARWQRSIDSVGPAKAYELFKAEAKDAGEKAHFMAHVFGTLLYEEGGLDGIGVCDDAFSYGCYHGFFGRAAQDRGATASEFLSHCTYVANGLGLGPCAHGIGHGLLGYFGYDRLVPVLEACDEVSLAAANSGCLSGALMEYNLRTMENRGKEGIRPFDPSHPYEPCDRISGRYGESCYYEQANWWLHVLDSDYAKVGSLCAAVKGDADRAACFRGIGNVVAFNSRYDVAKAISACSLMPDKDSVAMCRGRAAWGFLVYGPARKRALELCEGMSDSEKEECPSKGMVENLNFQ